MLELSTGSDLALFNPLGHNLKALLNARLQGIGKLYRFNEAVGIVKSGLEERYPEEQRHGDSTQLAEIISSRMGPFIELGGPTSQGYDLLSIEAVERLTGKHVKITNLSPEAGCYMLSSQADFASIEEFVDAKNLPYEPSSLGMVFASCMPLDVKERVADEVYRVLEEGGLWQYQRCEDVDVARALETGFHLLRYKRLRRPSYEYSPLRPNLWNTIFQK
jgi:hypothetical protein